MKKVVFGAVLVVLLTLSFIVGHWYALRNADKNTPENPAHTSDKSEIAPYGVKMEQVLTDDRSPDTTSASMPPGTVRITPERQQVVGVRTGVVEKAAVKHFIRTVGRIAPDEKRVYRLVAGTDGWIRETYNNDTGTFVKKDERLASFYSPLFRAAQLSYISLLGSSPDDRFHAGGRQALAPSQQASISLQTYIDALESLGMSEQQMKELASTRQITDRVYIVAPATGFIIARNVSPGQQFEKGAEWYRIADLSRVWVLADLFPKEAEHVRPGMKVRVTIFETKKTLDAVVSTVLPQFDATSRTLKARLELDNPGYALRPDMFVDVEIPITLAQTIAVPVDAVLDSGLRKTVFIDRGDGMFEPREVETGWRVGGRVQVLKGLKPGERIVTSGNFLVDSESRMELAAQGMYGTLAKDPVSGAEVSVSKAEKLGRKSSHRGKIYYFSSDDSKRQFDRSPERFVKNS
jgi:RND family efflux transporter MFP subunit